MTTEQPIIQVDKLARYYKQYRKGKGLKGSIISLFKRDYFTVKAVDDVSFSIDETEFVGFIGPNGAGKTTTLKCLSGLLYPTSGSVSVMGYIPSQRKREFLRQISLVMGQRFQLWWDLPAEDSFVLSKEIYSIPDEVYRKALKELVELLDIGEIINLQIRKLSLGQRMRCELAVALLHQPRVLFLDEPTIGLDVTMQKRMRDFFRDYNKQNGTTVILTSHNMDDVRYLCSRIIIINKGKIAYDGDIDTVVHTYAKEKYVHLQLSKQVLRKDLEVYGQVVDLRDGSVTLSIPRSEVSKISSRILEKLPVEDIDIKEMELDDVVRMIFSQK
jgi:ABC-2 type transport system ATP-binding protein